MVIVYAGAAWSSSREYERADHLPMKNATNDMSSA